MSTCWCKVLLSILVIVFAWVNVSWAPIALTVVGALLVILSLKGTCCCSWMRGKCGTPTDQKSGAES